MVPTKFSDGVRLNGLKLMAKHRIREGLPLCISILELQRWGKKARIQGCVEAISIYGAAAKTLLPQMRQLEKDLLAHRESKGFQPEIEKLRKLIRDIDASTEVPELRGLK